MRIGIVILPDERWSVAGRRWQRAEEYGFDHAWTYDHLGWRDLVDGPWFDAVPTLTAAAMVTRRIRLGTFVASPNFRHPVHFAREVTALDDISQGRLLLGVGAGGIGFDSAVLGAPELTPRRAGGPVRRVPRAARHAAAERPDHLARRRTTRRWTRAARPARCSSPGRRSWWPPTARGRCGWPPGTATAGSPPAPHGHGRGGVVARRWPRSAARFDDALDAAGRPATRGPLSATWTRRRCTR